MQSLIDKFLLKARKLARGEFTPRDSFSLSLILHGAFFMCLGLLLVWYEPTDLSETPLSIDFVFVPSESDTEALEAGHDLRHEKPPETRPAQQQETGRVQLKDVEQSRQQPATALTNPDSFSRNLPSEANSDEPGQDAAEVSGTESDESQQDVRTAEAVRPERYLLSSIVPTSFLRPPVDLEKRSAVNAKISMTRKEHKMFRKKFRKWTEDFHKMAQPDSIMTWRHKGKTYSASFRNRPAKSKTDIDEVMVEISKVEDGLALNSRMRMKRLAFSNFAQFVDFWDPWVAVHDDEFEGRFHANSQIRIVSARGVQPKFHGKVTTASTRIDRNGSPSFLGDESTFLGGLETGVKAIRLPRYFLPFATDSIPAGANLKRFDQDTRLVFRADGSYLWKTLGSDEPEQRVEIGEAAAYILGHKKKKLHVRGVVRGKVLIYSPGTIIIDDDLTYARNPEISAVADDYLGIVSDRDVEIAHPYVTGPGDLTIYAAIFAKRRFVVRHLRGGGDDTLFIYGSLTAGSLSATEPRYGTRIRFDKRLERKRPPGFPLSNRYEVSEWPREWEVKQN